MAIKPVCDKTREELTEPGGLVFGPRWQGRRRKFHLCVAAWKQFVQCPFVKTDMPLNVTPSRDDKTALAVEPPASVESSSWVRDYYIAATDWDEFVTWLEEEEKSIHTRYYSRREAPAIISA